MKFSIKDIFRKFRKFPADLVTFTEQILNGKLHFLCSDTCYGEMFRIIYNETITSRTSIMEL